jgi:hypothetical protein
MAGDWIKMRSDLFTHPKVVRISSALKADTLRTVGGLMSVWCLFDAHSVNGIMEGYSSETLDDHLRWCGFSCAMISVEWLVEDSGVLMLPRFDTHNGQSAKRRAQDADRKKVVRKTSASEADKMRTREEKRREDKYIYFADFWNAYPKKVGKGAAEKAWTKVVAPIDILMAAITKQKNSEQWRKDDGKFIPNPATWLNQKRWLDEIKSDGVDDDIFAGAR